MNCMHVDGEFCQLCYKHTTKAKCFVHVYKHVKRPNKISVIDAALNAGLKPEYWEYVKTVKFEVEI